MTLARPRTGGLLALAAVVVLLPLLLTNNFEYNVAIIVGLNAIACVGLNLLIGYAGQISLGHAAFYGLGAYASAILTAKYQWPAAAALVAGTIGVAALAFIVGRPILKLRGHYLAMGTLGLGLIISIVLNQEGSLTGGPDGMPVPDFRIFGLVARGEHTWYWIVGVLLVISVWLALNLIDSPAGRALRALHGSEIAAASAGINIARYKSMVFVVSSVFAAVSGSLFAHYSAFITPGEASFLRSLEFVTMVVLGGMASTFGAVVGAAILTVLPQITTLLHDYEYVLLGAVMIAVMVFMPKGLVPSIAAMVGARRK
jgi:branched-chain amino acid transport system permease protein